MLRAEDWDLNYRIRARGGRSGSRTLRLAYRPRPSVPPGLAVLPLRPLAPGDRPRAPGDGQFRYLAPPVAAALVTAGSWRPGRAGRHHAAPPLAAQWLTAGLTIPIVYLAGVTATGAALSRGLPAGVRPPDLPSRPLASCTCPGVPDFSSARAGCPRGREQGACRATGSGQRKLSRGGGENQRWTSISSPARRSYRRRIRAVRAVPEPAAPGCCTRSASTRSTPGPRARTCSTPRATLHGLPGRLRRVRGRPQPPGHPPGAARRAGRPTRRLDPVRLRPAARPAGGEAAGQGARPGPGVLLQQRHRGGGVGAEVRPVRHRPRPRSCTATTPFTG